MTPSDAGSNVQPGRRVRRFSAQDLEDDACAYSSDSLSESKSFARWNYEQNRIYPMDMRDFRRLVDVRVPTAAGRMRLGGPFPVVYFVQAVSGGPIKIGSSTIGSILQRLITLQIGNPLDLRIRRLVAGDWRVERGLHSYFTDHRTRARGEWFDAVPELEEIATPLWEREKR